MPGLKIETSSQIDRNIGWSSNYLAFLQGLDNRFTDPNYDYDHLYELSVSQDMATRSLTALYLAAQKLMSAGLAAQIVMSSFYINQISTSELPQKRRRNTVGRFIEQQDKVIGDFRYA